MSDVSEQPKLDVIFIQTKARRLVKEAEKLGVLIRIDLVPQQPLAMGNLAMVVDVRPARKQS